MKPSVSVIAIGLALTLAGGACSGTDAGAIGPPVADGGAIDAATSARDGESDSASPDADRADSAVGDGAVGSRRGFPVGSPWVSFYGPGAGIDLAKVAATFRVINVDVDPGADGVGNLTDAQIQTLRAGGKNKVISYLNVGACESYRTYWSTDPPGHKSCVNSGAMTDAYQGYPNEKWANLSSAAYRDLIVEYVAPRLAARGVDGFFLDNMEVIEHGPAPANGPCEAACAQGGLDLIWELRRKFPDLLIVMQNATSDVARLGVTHGSPYPSLLDGVSHEEVYTSGADPTSRAQMLAWKAMGLTAGNHPFWLAAEDYVGACSAQAKPAANAIYAKAQADGLNEYVTDASAMQTAPCFWADFP
jgi:cysteinyl-tRNA synthetase